MDTPIVSQKRCTKCDLLKPLSEFYAISGRPHLTMGHCKECHRAQTKAAAKWSRKVSTVPLETAVIAELAALGVPACPGKALAHDYADVIVWGCVLVECKWSDAAHTCAWTFTPKQQQRGLRGDVIVLARPSGERGETEFFLFDAKDPAFYKADGTLKSGVSYTENPRRTVENPALNGWNMGAALNNWSLIAAKRDQYCARLRAESARLRAPVALTKAA